MTPESRLSNLFTMIGGGAVVGAIAGAGIGATTGIGVGAGAVIGALAGAFVGFILGLSDYLTSPQ